MLTYEKKVEFDKRVGRWIATYSAVLSNKNTISAIYVVPDWAISRYGSQEPSLVDEVDEIFSLNFLFSVQSAEAQATAETPTSVASAAA